MAARRLAISSLLCDDDDAPSSSASAPASAPAPASASRPSTFPPKYALDHSPDPFPRPHHRPNRSQDYPNSSFPPAPYSSSPAPHPDRDFVPLSLQTAALRRRTPSPDSDPHPHQFPDQQTEYGRRPTTATISGREGVAVARREYYDPLPSDRQPHPLSYQSSPQLSAHMSRSPPSPPLSHFTRMPSHSPSSQSTVSLPSQRHAASPPLYPHSYPHRASASPGSYYQPPPPPPHPSHHRAPSRAQPQPQPQPQQQLPFPPQFSSQPRLDSTLSGPAYPPSTSRPVTASSSFPRSILNPVSPSVQSPLGGLEALVQAATVERRRMSGAGSLTNERRLDGFRTSASRSPEITFRRVAEPASQSLRPAATASTSPPFAYPDPSQRAPQSSQAFPHAEPETSRRLQKRKRRSDSHLEPERERSTMDSPGMPVESNRDVGISTTETRRPSLNQTYGRVEAPHSPVRGRGMELLADVTQELRGPMEGRRDMPTLTARRPWEDPSPVVQRYPQPPPSRTAESTGPAVVGWREEPMDYEIVPPAPAARDLSPVQALPPRFQRSTPPTHANFLTETLTSTVPLNRSTTPLSAPPPVVSHSPTPSKSRSRSPPTAQPFAPAAPAPLSSVDPPSTRQLPLLPAAETPPPHDVHPSVLPASLGDTQEPLPSPIIFNVPILSDAAPERLLSPAIPVLSPPGHLELPPPTLSPPSSVIPQPARPSVVTDTSSPVPQATSPSTYLLSPVVVAPSPITQDPPIVDQTVLLPDDVTMPEDLPASPPPPSPSPLESIRTPPPSAPEEASISVSNDIPSVSQVTTSPGPAAPSVVLVDEDEENHIQSQRGPSKSPTPFVEIDAKPEPADVTSEAVFVQEPSPEVNLDIADSVPSPLSVSKVADGELPAILDLPTQTSEEPTHEDIDPVEKTAETVSPSLRPIPSLSIMDDPPAEAAATIPSVPTVATKTSSPSPPPSGPIIVPPTTTADTAPQSTRESSDADEQRTDTPTVNSLDQELEEIANAVPDSHAMDIDIDRELAQELGLADEPQSREEPLRMDMDVDDELLSLVEDRPSTRPTEAPRAHHRPPKSKMSAPMKISSPVVGLSVPHSSSHHLFPSRSTSATVNSERESMPPPASTPGEGSRDRARTPKVDDRSQSSLKKKVTKQQPKLLAQPKPPRPKATAVPIKAKSKLSKEPASLLGTKGKKGPPIVPPPATAKASSSTARSRSTSVMPGPGPAALDATRGDKDKPKAAEEEEEEESDSEGKLYCICKTKYDDEKVMIACDRCDEWYHTACVNMSDDEVDLVDQFICPSCVEKEPQLDLRTTYKRRCLYGLKQRNPNSPDACHKPARGALSKYCSDECGIKYMQMRITVWTDNGGDKDRLWESVKNAERREGVVISAQLANGQLDGSANGKASKPSSVPGIVKPSKTKVTRELERLHAQLNGVVQKREEMRKEMDAVVWREKVTDLAIRRADAVEECGWDQRLCFGDEEVVEFGVGVLESYDVGEAPRATDAMQLDGPVEEPVWWCSGKKKCDRHAGWQKLRSAEVQFEKEMKEQALQKLTTREREIRKRVEDISEPHARLPAATANPPSSPTRPLLEPKPVANGVSRSRPNGDSKKGKKKKNEIL